MLVIGSKYKLKCKDCNIYLNEEIFCIKCSRRIAGHRREQILNFYNKFKITRYKEFLIHITPSHEDVIHYEHGCENCEEKIPETIEILLSIDYKILPSYKEILKEFETLFPEETKMARMLRSENFTLELNSELITDSD